MGSKNVEALYEDEDYELAQARLERLEKPLRVQADSDHLLYTSLEAIVLGSESPELKEGMVVCLLERFFLRVKAGLMN